MTESICRPTMLFFVLSVATSTCAWAQVTKLTSPEQFSEDAFLLTFEEVAGNQDPSELYASLGVFFRGEGSSRPTTGSAVIQPIVPPQIDLVIRNKSASGATTADGAPHEALIITFQNPLRRFGVTLGNGSQDTVAALSVLKAGGKLLGSIEQDDIDEVRGPFVGVETSDPEGISTIVLDYGDGENAEQLNEILLESLSASTFGVYLPQIGDGEANGLTLQTLIQISSVLQQPTSVRLLLFDSDGEALRLVIDTIFEFQLNGSGSKQFLSRGDSTPVKFGYAHIESDLPVTAHSIYRTSISDTDSVSKAGILGSEGRIVQVVPAERVPEQDSNTGIAVVNVSDKETDVLLRLAEESGLPPTDPRFGRARNRFILLKPGAHRAVFLSEVFDLLETKRFKGILRILSSQPVAVTALRTLRGVAVSSLSSGGTQR